MNRFLLILNVAAAASIFATNSASVLAAISPYGNSAPAKSAAVTTAEATSRPTGPEGPSDTMAVTSAPRVRLASVETGAVE